MPYHGNGPRAGRGVGRNRNTLVNNRSRGMGDPSTTLGGGITMGGATNTLYQQLALIMQQRGMVKGQFKMDRANIRAQQIANMGTAVNTALDRGMLHSSVDYAGRIGVQAEAQTAVQQAIQNRKMGMLGLEQQRISALSDFYTQKASVAAQNQLSAALNANAEALADYGFGADMTYAKTVLRGLKDLYNADPAAAVNNLLGLSPTALKAIKSMPQAFLNFLPPGLLNILMGRNSVPHSQQQR